MFPVFDAHCDTAFEMLRMGERLYKNRLHTDLVRGAQFQKRGQVYALWLYAKETKEAEIPTELERIFDNLLFELEENKDFISLCRTKSDIDTAFAEGKQAALVSCEGAELFSCDERELKRLFDKGLRILHLCWNSDNVLCGAALDSGEGLTARGRDFVRFAGELGVIIDLSHASDKTAFDVMELGKTAVLASHSNSRKVCNHPRNLSDELLRDIAQYGGVVGINLYPEFLGGYEISRVSEQALHMLYLCGEKAICLGADFDGISETPVGINGLEDMPRLASEFAAAGISEKLIGDIFFDNLMDFWERVL